jgi:hypothetical protein
VVWAPLPAPSPSSSSPQAASVSASAAIVNQRFGLTPTTIGTRGGVSG